MTLAEIAQRDGAETSAQSVGVAELPMLWPATASRIELCQIFRLQEP
jgi:hypothetical protein